MAHIKLSLIILMPVLLISGCMQMEDADKNNILSEDISISPDDQYILFSFYKNNISAIYRADIDGKNVKQLTFPKNESHLGARYSPDGQKILFLAFPQHSGKPQSYLYLMDADGANIKQMTTGEQHITEAIFSPNGKTIFFMRSGFFGHYSPIVGSRPHEFDVFLINIDSSNLKRITEMNDYEMRGLSITSDGKSLLFGTGSSKEPPFHFLSLENLKQISSFTPVGNFGSDLFYNPRLSPNNELIAFSAVSKSAKPGYRYELYLMDAKSKSGVRQVTNLESYVGKYCFFNKQNKLLFIQDLNWPEDPPIYQLMSINTDGTNLMKINLDIP